MYATYASYLREAVTDEVFVDAASVRHYDLGVVAPSYQNELNEVLGSADPRIAIGRFHLYGAVLDRDGAVLDRDTDVALHPAAPVMPYLITDRGDGSYLVVLLLNEERLVDLIKSDITQMRDDVSIADSGAIGLGPAVAVADFAIVPGASVVHHAAVELAEPVLGAITTGLGLGKGAQLRSAARDLAMNGISPATYDRTAPTVLRSVSDHAPQLLSPESVARAESFDPAFNTSTHSTLAQGAWDSHESAAPAAYPPRSVDVDEDENERTERALHLEVPRDRVAEQEVVDELELGAPARRSPARSPAIDDRTHVRTRDYHSLSLE